MAADSEKGTTLQFGAFQSRVDEGFWHKLSSFKLNKLGIDDSPIPITGMIIFWHFNGFSLGYICTCPLTNISKIDSFWISS